MPPKKTKPFSLLGENFEIPGILKGRLKKGAASQRKPKNVYDGFAPLWNEECVRWFTFS